MSKTMQEQRVKGLYRSYLDGGISRREFMQRAAAAGAGGAWLGANLTDPAELLAQVAAGSAGPPLDIAEWSYFFVGVERAELARGTVTNGQQMYVEYQIPAVVKYPYPIVLVHGGGGQGLDWMGTPDGRRGWATILLEQGYKVYIVDRPGHGRAPYHPEVHGAFGPTSLTLETLSGRFTPPNANAPDQGPLRKGHNQWPGTGEVGSPDLSQMVASQGGSYGAAGNAGPLGPAQPPAGAAGGAPAAGGRGAAGGPGGSGGFGPGPGGGRGAAPAGPPPVLGPTGSPAGGPDPQHMIWRQRGAMLLDKIGPAIIMTHSAGGPFGWLVAEERPNLVKGIVAIEGGGTPFNGQNAWGLSTIPVAYDPPVSNPSEIKTVRVESPETGVQPYLLQAEPARKLKNLRNIPVVIVTADSSFASPGNPGAVAYLKQAGVKAEELRLIDHGVKGNGHMMMLEKNNREALKPITDWIVKTVPANGAKVPSTRGTAGSKADSTAMKLENQGYFWVGTETRKMPYGTIIVGQMYVQYLIPAQVRHPFPVVLVHGGGGSMLHYMGLGEQAGWAHYYVQEGYKVYLVDRPGHGRSPYHPDALGPIGPHLTYSSIAADFRRAATGPNKRWAGSGDVGDPLLDQFQAGQNSPPADNVMAHGLWASRGAELLDKIGPAIIQVHSAGGPFGYLVANERPNLVKGIVDFEGGWQPFAGQARWGITGTPFVFDPPVTDPSQLSLRQVTPESGQPYQLQQDPPRKLKNLQGIPIALVTAEASGRNPMPKLEFLRQTGCTVDNVDFKSRGILGNGHFMMFETNKRQCFDIIRGWIEEKIKA